MSVATQVADDVTTAINLGSQSWHSQLTATRRWQPLLSLSPSTELTQIPLATGGVADMSVIPDSTPQIERLTRSTQRETHVIMLVMQVELADVQNANIDPWVAILEAIKDYFWIQNPGGPPAIGTYLARAMQVAVETYCYRPHLETQRVYTGALSLNMQVQR